ncbi:protein phosphatase 1 regulatory subunit 26 [Paramormyrops kingsleyae]|uniref:protein phosphatase 1 regulatory subunit 26 n=1 Tax=Paramormyrops kingsleyae TaxID=1676925 RepID=UPI003B979E16
MFLKNVLPAFAMHTEWRSYGPASSFSMPSCFDDSSSVTSTTSSLIPGKVQMIIDSLRSTQSSLNMNEENGGTLQTGEPRAPGYNGKTSHVVQKARQRGAMSVGRTQKQNTEALKLESQSQDSDSDDSVDRGIEEAIQEYLKEKGDPKQSMKLNTNPLQMSKQLKRNFSSSETQKYLDRSKILTASNYAPKNLKASYSMAMERIPFHKEKHDGNSLSINITDVNKAQVIKNAADVISLSKTVQPPSVVKEEKTPESSSDDGIEEAIWHYQLEKKKKHEGSRTTSKVFQAKEESDSSSDDGIEEAIRHYQLEKQKEKHEHTTKAFKPSHPKPTQVGKTAALSSEKPSNQAFKKQKMSSKRKISEKLPKSTIPSAVVPDQVNTPFDNKVALFKNNPILPLETPLPLKVNTTAELMCAEAILDISKTVMPRSFEETSSPSNPCIESPSLPTEDCPNWSDNKSNDSSVDSDDGIEQEIRKFLESKAQMHKQQLVDTKYERNQDDIWQKNADSPQSKKLKPTLSHKRKRKEDNFKAGKGEGPEQEIKEPVSQTRCDGIIGVQASGSIIDASVVIDVTTKSAETMKDPDQKCYPENPNNAKGSALNEGDSPLATVKNEVSGSPILADRLGESGDKSSSLDSDEDLDAAIKDLLKTKRRLRKKTKDKKVKSRKKFHSGIMELSHEESEKKKILLESKIGTIPKNCDETSKHTVGTKRKLSNMSSKLTNKKVKPCINLDKSGDAQELAGVETFTGCASQIVEDSSSVDSDDSIEQEIRKFLAEKAKVSTMSISTEEFRKKSISTTDFPLERSMSLEAQQAEISPTLKAPYFELSERSGSEQDRSQDGQMLQSTSPDFYYSQSSKSDQAASREMDALKMQKRSIMTLEDSRTQSSRPEMERCKSEQNFTSNCITEAGPINQVMPSAETTAFQSQSQNLFCYSELSPHSDRSVNMTSATNLQNAVIKHQDKGSESAKEVCNTCPLTCDTENMCKNTLMNPFKRSPETASPASLPYSSCLPDRLFKQDTVSDQGHPEGTSLLENMVQVKKDPVTFSKEEPHEFFCVQVRNRDLIGAEDGRNCYGETVDGKQVEGEQVREERKDCVENSFESCEERISADQRSDQSQNQHPGL